MSVAISPGAQQLARDMIKRFEGYRGPPYRDPVGVPTQGYGFTTLADGSPVTMDSPPLTEAQAEALLSAKLLRDYAPAVQSVTGGVPLSDNVAAALLDFAWNLGVGCLERSGIGPMVQRGDLVAAAARVKQYNQAGGKVLPGLVARRAAEAGMLLAGATVAAVPSGHTADKPPPPSAAPAPAPAAPAAEPQGIIARAWTWITTGN